MIEVRLICLSELLRWLAAAWQMVPIERHVLEHPVEVAYGKVRVWRAA